MKSESTQGSVDNWRRQEQILDSFEQAWQRGETPKLVDYLPEDMVERTTLLVELVRVDMEFRRRAGLKVELDDYRRQFPDLPLHTEGHVQASQVTYSTASRDGQQSTTLNANAPEMVSAVDTAGTIAVPGYEILGELGRGGMGVVYKARQLHLNRLVALKMILTGKHSTSINVLRFFAEAEAVAALRHPNIVQIYEVNQTNKMPYMALELIDGGSLAECLREGSLPPLQAARLVEQLARAINAAHQAGIVHRDLKPGNILLQIGVGAPEEPRSARQYLETVVPKISDFGLAKRVKGGGDLTETGDILGTPCYMAPEQARGAAKEVGPAADVYALGAILYELLTGRPPFKAATSLETVMQVINEEPVPPSQIKPGVARDLETICLKCLQKEPHKRYGSSEALADELRRVQAGEPILARPVGTLERSVKWVKRRPAVASLLGLMLVLGVVGCGIMAYQWNETELARRVALKNAEEYKKASEAASTNAAKYKQASEESSRNEQLAKQEATRAADEAKKARLAEANERIARDRYGLDRYLAHMNLAKLAWDRADIPVVKELLEKHIPKDGDIDRRGFEWDYYWRLCHSDLYTLKGLPGAVRALAFSPRGRMLAVSCTVHEPGIASWKLLLWDAEARRKPVVLSERHKAPAAVVPALAFDREGKTLAAAGSAQGEAGVIQLWDVATGKERRSLIGHKYPIIALAFAADGQTLASAATDLRTSRDGNVQDRQGIHVQGNEPGEIKLWDTESGKEISSFSAVGPVLTLAFSMNEELIVGSGDGSLKKWQFARKSQETSFPLHRAPVWSVAMHPGGKIMASAAGNWNGSSELALWNLATKKPLPLQGHTAGVLGCAISPDGNTLASASFDRTVRLWNANTGEELSAIRGHTDTVQGLSFSADGRILATGSWDGTVKLWDLFKPQEWITLDSNPNGGGYRVQFSPDGKKVMARRTGTNLLKAWDIDTLELVATVSANRLVALDGKMAYAGFDEPTGSIRVWMPGTNSDEAVLTIAPGKVSAWEFSPDLKWLATELGKGSVKVWNCRTGQAHAQVSTVSGAAVSSMRFSPDNNTLVVADWHSYVSLLDVSTGQKLEVFHAPRLKVRGPIWDIVFTRSGKKLALGTAQSTDFPDSLCIWDDITDKSKVKVLKGHKQNVYALALSPDDRTLAAGDQNHQLKLWDMATGEERLALKGPSRAIYSLAFSPDGKTIAAGYVGQFVLFRATSPKQKVEISEEKRALLWHRREADNALTSGQWSVALFHLDRLLKTKGEDPELLYLRGCAHANTGHSAKALADLTKALERKSNDPEWWYTRGRVHGLRKEWDEALADYTKAIELAPRNDFFWVRRSLVQARLGQEDEASKDFAQAVNLFPVSFKKNEERWWYLSYDCTDLIDEDETDYSAWRARAFAYARLGSQWAKASRDITKAMTLHSTDAATWLLHGIIHAGRGRYAEAAAAYSKAIAHGTKEAPVWQRRGNAYVVLKQWEKAVADCSKAIDLGTEGWEIWSQRGLAQLELGQWEAAIADHSKAIALRATGGTVWANRALAHSRLGQWDKVVADASQAIFLGEDTWQIRNQHGFALAELGKWNKAADEYARVVAVKTDDFSLWRAHALLCLQRDDREEARKAVASIFQKFASSKAIDFASEAPSLCVRTNKRLMDWTKVLQLAEQGAKRNPQSYDHRVTLGAALFRAGRAPAALEQLQQALRLDPTHDHLVAGFFLGMVYHRLGRLEDARYWRDKSMQQTSKLAVGATDAKTGRSRLPWTARLELELLRREAELYQLSELFDGLSNGHIVATKAP